MAPSIRWYVYLPSSPERQSTPGVCRQHFACRRRVCVCMVKCSSQVAEQCWIQLWRALNVAIQHTIHILAYQPTNPELEVPSIQQVSMFSFFKSPHFPRKEKANYANRFCHSCLASHEQESRLSQQANKIDGHRVSHKHSASQRVGGSTWHRCKVMSKVR